MLNVAPMPSPPLSPDSKPLTLYTSPLSPEQARKLRALLEDDGYKFEPKPYTLYYASKDKLNVAVYEKGPKVVLQGKGTGDFVTFRLEPEILGEAKLGYEEVHNPAMFEPHLGIDESGKGDFFGPLVIAGCYTDAEITRALMQAGIMDSKRIGTDARIRELAEIVRHTPGIAHNVVSIGPETYNRLYAKFKNLNRLLAWGHAKVIENLLEARPDCPRSLSDQFAKNPRLIQSMMGERGKKIVFEQRTRAESDIAVAAASILARERFIDWMRTAGTRLGKRLPYGASDIVKTTAREIVAERGGGFLRQISKTHFNTAADVCPELFTKPPLPEEDVRAK
jgi:ribonuclease HIII